LKFTLLLKDGHYSVSAIEWFENSKIQKFEYSNLQIFKL
jgi:hypothetical protein